MAGLTTPPEAVDLSDHRDRPQVRYAGPNRLNSDRPPVPPAQRAIRIAALILFWLFAVAVTLIVLGQDKVPNGTTVAGVDIGGMSRDEAIAKLDAALAKKSTDPVALRVAKDAVRVEPAALGLATNIPLTVDSAMTSRWNLFDTFGEWIGGGEADLVVRSDNATMTAKLADLNDKYAAEAREPEITYSGIQPVLDEPVIGSEIKIDEAIQTLMANYLRTESAIQLPMTERHPQVSLDQAREVLQGSATRAVSAPIAVKVGEVTAQATPQDVAQSLTYRVQEGQLRPSVDGKMLHELLAPQLKSVDTRAKDATWDVSSGKPVLVPAVPGNGVTDDHVRDSVTEVLERTGADRTVVMPLGPLEPKLTTDEAAKLNITEKISSFTQNFPYAQYRVQNIGQAAKKVNKTLLYPGETFSMNDTVGERTKANGFTKGYVVGEGGRMREDYGGGVSTAATTLWTAAFFAGLERVEQGSHLIWISRYRPGLEATVAWGLLDLKFKNNTSNGVYITTKMTNGSITVTMWGTKQYDNIKAVSGEKTNVVPFTKETGSGPACVPQGGVPGFNIAVDRVFFQEGKEIKRETFHTSYIPAAQVTCSAAAPDKSAKPAAGATPAATAPAPAAKPSG